jgi:hypothetical protein
LESTIARAVGRACGRPPPQACPRLAGSPVVAEETRRRALAFADDHRLFATSGATTAVDRGVAAAKGERHETDAGEIFANEGR